MAEIVAGLTVAGFWVVGNYTGILTSASSIGGPLLIKKYLINPLLKKKNTKKLLKYITDENINDVYNNFTFFVKDLDSSKIYNMKNRIKKHKKYFKKLNIEKHSEKVLAFIVDSLKDDKSFNDFNEKYNMIENVIEMLIITRKYSSKNIKDFILGDVLEFLIDYDLSDLKQFSMYIENQKRVFIQSFKEQDVIGYLEMNLEMNDYKDNLLHLLKKVNFDIERKYQVEVSPSPSFKIEMQEPVAERLTRKKTIYNRYKK